MSKTTQTWQLVRKPNMFDPKTVGVSKTITPLERSLLLFKRMQISIDVGEDDSSVIVYYKRMGGMIYVLKIIRKQPR